MCAEDVNMTDNKKEMKVEDIHMTDRLELTIFFIRVWNNLS